MAARFAGSRSVDERRRRRLAVDAEDIQFEGAPVTKVGRKGEVHVPSEEAACEGPLAQFPMRKLISPRKWKLFLFALILLGGGAGILSAGFFLDEVALEAGEATASLFDFQSGHMIRWYSVCCTFLAGQLAMLVGWFRARNPKDFDGRYRIWIPASLCCFVTSFCLATNAHRAWSDALLHVWGIDFWNRESLAWMALALGAAPVILLGVHQDMQSSRFSRALLWSAVLCWSLAAFRELQFDPGFAIPEEYAPLADRGVEMLGHILLLLCMLTHARHVLYITARPPEAGPSLLGRLVRRIPMPRIRFRRKSVTENDEQATEVAESGTKKRPRTKKAAAARGTTKRKTTRKTPARSAKSRTTEEVEEGSDEAETVAADMTSGRSSASTTVSATTESRPTSSKASNSTFQSSSKTTEAASGPAKSGQAAVAASSTSPGSAFNTKPQSPTVTKPVSSSTAAFSHEDLDAEDSDEDSWNEDSSDGNNIRLDGGVDKNSLKGLSKRERRALRKQAKDQQRAARGG